MALISETTRPIKLSPVYAHITGGATLFHCPVILGMTDLHTMLFKELLRGTVSLRARVYIPQNFEIPN